MKIIGSCSPDIKCNLKTVCYRSCCHFSLHLYYLSPWSPVAVFSPGRHSSKCVIIAATSADIAILNYIIMSDLHIPNGRLVCSKRRVVFSCFFSCGWRSCAAGSVSFTTATSVTSPLCPFTALCCTVLLLWSFLY